MKTNEEINILKTSKEFEKLIGGEIYGAGI